MNTKQLHVSYILDLKHDHSLLIKQSTHKNAEEALLKGAKEYIREKKTFRAFPESIFFDTKEECLGFCESWNKNPYRKDEVSPVEQITLEISVNDVGISQ
jgi:hypothetical protein